MMMIMKKEDLKRHFITQSKKKIAAEEKIKFLKKEPSTDWGKKMNTINPNLPDPETSIKRKWRLWGSQLCTYSDNQLKALVNSFISYAPLLDQLLALAPRHLMTSEIEMIATNSIDLRSETSYLKPFLEHCISVKENILNKESLETNPKFNFYRGNVVQFLLDVNLSENQKINYLKCLHQYRVEALAFLLQDIQYRQFKNLCPWTTEKNYLTHYSIFQFYRKDVQPIYYLLEYYAALLVLFTVGKVEWMGTELLELKKNVQEFKNTKPFYIFSQKKDLENYMLLNKEAQASNTTEEEKNLIKKLESLETPREFRSGDTYKPLSHYFFTHIKK